MEALANIDLGQWSGLALALGLGLLVGIQRGWAHREEAAGTRFAGIRTFGLIGLAGGIAGTLFEQAQIVSTIIMAATAVLILISYYRESERENAISGTTSIVGLITMACGFLAAHGARLEAIVIAVPMMLLLSLRTQLHALVERMNEKEVRAIARFAVIGLVILPMLPNRAFGPFDAWNPHRLWLVVVLVSGISFAGYVAARLLGAVHGAIATSAAGALVSSTAVTASASIRLKEGAENYSVHNTGIAAASFVMFVRMLTLVGLIAPFALPTLAMLAAPGLLVSLAAAVLLFRRANRGGDWPPGQVDVKNPFALRPALILMGLVMIISLAARWVLAQYGDAEVALVLTISGAVDVDSAVITMGNLPPDTLRPHVAGLALFAPMMFNTLFKAGVATSIAGWRRAWPGILTLVLSVVASLAALPLVL